MRLCWVASKASVWQMERRFQLSVKKSFVNMRMVWGTKGLPWEVVRALSLHVCDRA